MTRKKIRSFSESGVWITPHRFYFPMAQSFLQQAKDLSTVLQNKATEIEQKSSGEERNTFGYDRDLFNENHRQVVALAVATQIFTCMAVEAFLNYYGVKLLGEQHYKRNIERLGINQKLETLIAISLQELLDDKEEITIIVKRMFERRNRLVHPKSKEMIMNEKFVLPEFPNELEQAENAIKDMTMFFDKFQEIDESTRFENPNITSR